MVTFGY